jgi:hypothetical protein
MRVATWGSFIQLAHAYQYGAPHPKHNEEFKKIIEKCYTDEPRVEP